MRAARWKWEVNLIGSKQINAFCMPGGKIAFFLGILDKLEDTLGLPPEGRVGIWRETSIDAVVALLAMRRGHPAT